MTDATIKPGDVVHDLTQNSKMQVVARAADSVADYRELEDFGLSTYKSHPLFRVSDDEPVFTCVYLKGEVGIPSGTYDFPESRLARIPVEEANQDLDRVQEEIVTQVLAQMFVMAQTLDDEWSAEPEDFENAISLTLGHIDIGSSIVDKAKELAESSRFGGDEQ